MESYLRIQPQGNAIAAGTFVEKSILEIVDPNNENRRCRCDIASLKVGAAIVSASARVFYIPVSLELPAGPVFAFANTTACFALEYWASSKTIDELFINNSSDPNEHPNKSTARTISTFVLAEFIALSSQVPMAFVAYNYNSKDIRILGALVTGVSGSLFPLRSLQLSFNEIGLRKKLDDVEKKLSKIKQELKALLRTNQSDFLTKNQHDRLTFLLDMENVRTISDRSEKIDTYFRHIMSVHEQQVQSQSTCRKIATYGVQATGAVLTISLQAALAMYTFTQTKDYIYDDNYVAGAFSAVVVASNTFLMSTSVIGTSTRLFNTMIELFTGSSTPSIAEKIRPKLAFSLKTLGLITDALAIGPTIVIWGQFFSDNLFEERYFQTTISSSVFLILFTATLDLIDDVVEYAIAKKGTESEKEFLKMSKEFNELEAMLDRFSHRNIGELLRFLPEELQNRLLNKFELTCDKLDEYLQPQSTDSLLQ